MCRYGSYYTALSINAFTNLDPEPGNSMDDVWHLTFGKTVAYGACISMLGLFVVLQLRKVCFAYFGTKGGPMYYTYHRNCSTNLFWI